MCLLLVASCKKDSGSGTTDSPFFVNISDNGQSYNLVLGNSKSFLTGSQLSIGSTGLAVFSFNVVDTTNSSKPLNLFILAQSATPIPTGIGELRFGNTPAGNGYSVSYSLGTESYISDLSSPLFPSATAGKVNINKVEGNVAEGSFDLKLKSTTSPATDKTLTGTFRIPFF